MKPLYRIAIVIALLTICACDNPSSSFHNDIPMEGAAAYFPVSVGSRWVYETTVSPAFGVPFGGMDTVTVADIQGNVVTLRDGGPEEIRYRITEDVVTQVYEINGNADTSAHVIRAPLSIGTQWQSYSATHEIVAVDTTIDTPAGTFDDVIAVRILTCAGWGEMMCKTSYYILVYYAKGVGLVKSVTTSYGPRFDSPAITRQLVAFGR